MILGQLTDLHIRAPGALAYRHVDTATCLKRAIAQLNDEPVRPDLLLLTGDLTDWGEDEEYAHLAEILKTLSVPFRLMPGNHDDRVTLRRAFPSHTYLGATGPAAHAFDLGALRVIALDTSVPDESGGNLGPDQRAWLSRELAASGERPVIVAMHHPPFATGIAHMDAIGLADADAFARIIAAHTNIRRIICGHVHRAITTTFAGTIASIAPSVAHQLTVGLEPNAPACFTDEPGSYQLHCLTPAHDVVSHDVRIGNWNGPYPFFDNKQLIR